MYCDNCGEELPEGARFCKNCGAEVPQSYMNQKKTSGIFWVIVALVGAIILFGLFSLTGTSDDVDLLLKNVSTSGYAYESVSNGDEVYNYTLTGDFGNLPENTDDYTVKAIFLDGEREIGQYEGELTGHISAELQKSELLNVTQIKVIVQDSGSDEVFSHTYDYDMDDFDLSELEDDDSSSFSFIDDRDFSFSSDD